MIANSIYLGISLTEGVMRSVAIESVNGRHFNKDVSSLGSLVKRKKNTDGNLGMIPRRSGTGNSSMYLSDFSVAKISSRFIIANDKIWFDLINGNSKILLKSRQKNIFSR